MFNDIKWCCLTDRRRSRPDNIDRDTNADWQVCNDGLVWHRHSLRAWNLPYQPQVSIAGADVCSLYWNSLSKKEGNEHRTKCNGRDYGKLFCVRKGSRCILLKIRRYNMQWRMGIFKPFYLWYLGEFRTICGSVFERLPCAFAPEWFSSFCVVRIGANMTP